MDHLQALTIFRDIQARPYNVSSARGVPSDNCFFKGTELLQKLGTLGYAVRGRIGETYWDTNVIPADIVAMLPGDILVTHFYTEVLLDGEWCIADPSFQPALGKLGFPIGSFGPRGQSCFPITRLYTQEESMAYQATWHDPAYIENFFGRGAAGWKALSAWFAQFS